MIISVMNLKGGVGKSSISYNVAKYFNLKMITNDKYTAINNIKQIIGGTQINIEDNSLYDFGGFDDVRINTIIEKSDVIIIPTLYSRADLQNTVISVKKITTIKKNAKIVIVINRVRSTDGKLLDETKETLQKYIKYGVEYCTIRDSKAMLYSINNNKSVFEIHKESGLNRHIYAGIVNDFYFLITTIENYLNN
jgi:cellulose biosynthesis protein BcsQ